MSSSVILNEEIDEEYEPNEEELIEYGKFLGMDFPEDEEFLYIAKEGLKAPLPEPWKPCQTKTGDIYFFNFESGESVWEHPCDTYYKDLFIEAKNKKKAAVKKPPLQESKDRPKKQTLGLPKSFSPVGFEKKKDILLEIIQIEKETKKNKDRLIETLENELQAQIKDLNMQKEIEIKLFKDNIEKDTKKKTSATSKELESLEETEKKIFESNLNEKIKEIKNENDRLIEDERKKAQEKTQKELILFENELNSKFQKSLETEIALGTAAKKEIGKEIEDYKEIYNKKKNNNIQLEESLKEELKKEENRIRKENKKSLEDFKKDQEYELQRAMISGRNRKSHQTLQEKIKELKEEYKAKEEVQKKNESKSHEEEVKELYKDLNSLNTALYKDMQEIERSKQLEEVITAYKIKKREEIIKINQEVERKININKEILDRNYKDKINLFKDKQAKPNYTDLEQKAQNLVHELDETKDKIKIAEEKIARMEVSVMELKKNYDSLKKNHEKEQENLPKSQRIRELRQKINEKDQELEKLRNYNPDKLFVLENEIKSIKSIIERNYNGPTFNYEEKVERKSLKIPLEKKNSEVWDKKDEELKENLISDDDELLGDWRKDESWSISRDISPVGVDTKSSAYKRPQFPTRAWIKPKENIRRYSGAKKIGSYLY